MAQDEKAKMTTAQNTQTEASENLRKNELVRALVTKVCQEREVPEVNFPLEFYGELAPLMKKIIDRRGEVPSVEFMQENYGFKPSDEKDNNLTVQDTIELLARIYMTQATRATVVEYIAQQKKDFNNKEPTKVIEELVQRLNNISSVVQSNAAIDVIGEADRIAHAYEKRINNQTPIVTGFKTLDEEVAPETGQLMLLCAPMKRGKTTAMTYMFASAIRANLPALFVSLEMNEVEMTNKLLSTMGKAKYSDLRKGKVDPSKYKEFCQELGKNRAVILTPAGIRGAIGIRTVEKYIQENSPKIVFVDYLALLSGVDMNWNAAVQPTAEFKRMAQQYDCLIVVALQADPNLLKGAGDGNDLESLVDGDSGGLPIPEPTHVRANKNLGADCDIFLGLNSMKMMSDQNQMEFHFGVQLNRHGHTPAFIYNVDLDKGMWKEKGIK